MNPRIRAAIMAKYVDAKPIEYPAQSNVAFNGKVLICPHGIGIASLAHALRGQGVHATSCSFYNDVYSYLSDLCLNMNMHPVRVRKLIRDAFLEEAIQTYDTFHFRFGGTLFSDKRDLKLLAKRGKKLVVHHSGDEVRLLPVARSYNNPYVRRREAWPDERIRENLKLLTSCVDQVIVNDHELLPHVEPHYKKVHVVPYAIDTRALAPHYPPPSDYPLVVHASSHRNVKGTEFVLEAVERLQAEGKKFEFKLVEKMPHAKALELYRESSIIIDQLTVGTYANLSMEAMAMGKPVICYVRDDLRGVFPADLPIVSANPDTIYDVLKDLLGRPADWMRLGMQGRKFVERHHDPDRVARMLIDVYRGL
ncbi:glycosyltransferase family 4 protein [Paenibacillus sp. LHD-117]|uniref:glycosyltransferase family 4 protein n=1 Tax=Paenibacillus sp. LHD-117 TaxID=3071412 RepID=UPI0027DF5920|nr:glycosyltransferase family 4 protein [Paenibacillus sp. LHD-117]MDQ6418343.1 glycosyltransferase family 4 protein [Paenibacillus sp. LHD-117]